VGSKLLDAKEKYDFHSVTIIDSANSGLKINKEWCVFRLQTKYE
jgi:hypothetical protein